MSRDQCEVRHQSKMFSFDKRRKLIVVELSTLGPNPFGRVWMDAADEGMTIVSERTGQLATFAVEKVQRDSENEIEVYILYPTPATVRMMPELRNWRLHVLND